MKNIQIFYMSLQNRNVVLNKPKVMLAKLNVKLLKDILKEGKFNLDFLIESFNDLYGENEEVAQKLYEFMEDWELISFDKQIKEIKKIKSEYEVERNKREEGEENEDEESKEEEKVKGERDEDNKDKEEKKEEEKKEENKEANPSYPYTIQELELKNDCVTMLFKEKYIIKKLIVEEFKKKGTVDFTKMFEEKKTDEVKNDVTKGKMLNRVKSAEIVMKKNEPENGRKSSVFSEFTKHAYSLVPNVKLSLSSVLPFH
ncbi:unnamed protein product [Meloidogyne enterolobii]|uniref:Uncharacterized protein n=1 Tax=Meloidogyne enterolobii TaxID=390850 RepID=A0ACB1A676_MELEN